jgi:hypothetical protein
VKAHRPKQQLPQEIVSDLMAAIRGPFYGDATPKQWAQDYHFIRDRVVLWPATWLDKRGITLKPERYKAIILEVLQEIKHHGNTGHITYWPAYLAKCVQERFKHRAEDIYEEGKNLRAQMENVLTGLAVGTRSTASHEIDPIRALAEARRDLLKAKNTRRAKTPAKQLSLL